MKVLLIAILILTPFVSKAVPNCGGPLFNGYCFEKLEPIYHCLELQEEEDTELCIKPVGMMANNNLSVDVCERSGTTSRCTPRALDGRTIHYLLQETKKLFRRERVNYDVDVANIFKIFRKIFHTANQDSQSLKGRIDLNEIARTQDEALNALKRAKTKSEKQSVLENWIDAVTRLVPNTAVPVAPIVRRPN